MGFGRAPVAGKRLIAFNKTKGVVIFDDVEVAVAFTRRLVGLIGRKSSPRGSALLIHSCRSIHTFFMGFPIDAVFLDAEGRVVAVEEEIRPFAVKIGPRGASGVLELPAGAIESTRTAPGDEIAFLARSVRKPPILSKLRR